MVFVSVMYFRASAVVRHWRCGFSPYGAVAALIYLAGMAVWLFDRRLIYGTPYAAAFVVPVIVLLSFFLFRGPARTRLLQLLNVPAMLWAALWIVAITGEWL
jgi:hypothetical protein